MASRCAVLTVLVAVALAPLSGVVCDIVCTSAVTSHQHSRHGAAAAHDHHAQGTFDTRTTSVRATVAPCQHDPGVVQAAARLRAAEGRAFGGAPTESVIPAFVNHLSATALASALPQSPPRISVSPPAPLRI